MTAQLHACPVCGAKEHYMTLDGEALFDCGARSRTANCPNAERLAITRAKRIAHLEAALTRIKTLADAPDPDACLHARDLGYTQGASRVMEWAVNEAENALKETP